MMAACSDCKVVTDPIEKAAIWTARLAEAGRVEHALCRAPLMAARPAADGSFLGDRRSEVTAAAALLPGDLAVVRRATPGGCLDFPVADDLPVAVRIAVAGQTRPVREWNPAREGCRCARRAIDHPAGACEAAGWAAAAEVVVAAADVAGEDR